MNTITSRRDFHVRKVDLEDALPVCLYRTGGKYYVVFVLKFWLKILKLFRLWRCIAVFQSVCRNPAPATAAIIVDFINQRFSIRSQCRHPQCLRTRGFYLCTYEDMGARSSAVVKALRYKPAGRGFDFQLCHWNFSVS